MSLLGTAAVAVHMLLGQLPPRRLPSFLYSWLVFAVAASVLAVYNVGMNIPMTGYSGREWGIFALLAVANGIRPSIIQLADEVCHSLHRIDERSWRAGWSEFTGFSPAE